MARIRTIKPEFWTDETLAECSMIARLLFVAALNFADDNGNLERSSRQLKAQAFPYDSIDCEPLVCELVRTGLFIEYQISDRKYLHIKGFLSHQKIDRPSKCRIPIYESSMSVRPTLDEPSTSPRPVRESSLVESSVRIDAHAPRETEIREHMDLIRSRYPKAAREDWITAEKRARNLVSDEGVGWSTLIDGVNRYRKHCDATNRIPLNPARFFGDIDRPWHQDWPIPPKRGEKAAPSNEAAWAEARSRAKAIGFRDPWPQESPNAYMTEIKQAEIAPRNGPRSIAGLTEKLRMPA